MVSNMVFEVGVEATRKRIIALRDIKIESLPVFSDIFPMLFDVVNYNMCKKSRKRGLVRLQKHEEFWIIGGTLSNDRY